MSLRSEVGATLRRWQWWRDLQRVRAEGAGRAFRRRRRWSGVLRGAPIRTDRPGQGPVEIHLLCYRGDYLCAIWALKTLYLTSGARWPIVIHLQGSATAAMIRRLRRHFPEARLIGQQEADEEITRTLSTNHPRLLKARRQSPMMMKLVDPTVFAGTERILILDSDVLFFRAPLELQSYMERDSSNAFLFQRDRASNYNITADEALSAFGIRLPECVNCGIGVVPRAIVDFQLCERLLEHPKVQLPTGLIEQTLYALCAGASGGVNYLSCDYLLSLERGLDYEPLTARHYAGPSRPLLTEEGMPYAVSCGVFGRA